MNQPVKVLPKSPRDDLNKQLAELLGWEKLHTEEYGYPVGELLVGYPPEGNGFPRGVPNWAGNLLSTQFLMFKFGISLYLSNDEGVTANIVKLDAPFMSARHFEKYSDHDTKGEAAALAITMAAIKYLAQKKDIEERAKTEPWPWPKAEDFV